MRKNKYGGINDLKGWASNSGSCNKLKKNIYDTWFRMLERVHTRPSYVGCTIEPSWYLFSNFVNDFKSLPGYKDFELSNGIGYVLDKDIRFIGNKHYGPLTCSLVTNKENNLEMHRRLGHSIGVIYGLDDNGQVVETYRNLVEAELHGYSRGTMSRAITRKLKYRGKYWVRK